MRISDWSSDVCSSDLLDSLIDRQVLVSTATKERFSVSDTALRQTIASMPQLPVNGQFSSERYNQVLASAGLTTRDFEQSQRAELAPDRVLGPLALPASVPPLVINQLELALTEQRTVRVQAFPASDYEKDLVISDADIPARSEERRVGKECVSRCRSRGSRVQ